MGTHQELEMFGSQPAYPEKLLHKKESLQNQLINIRVELSQASTVPAPAPGTIPTTRGEKHQQGNPHSWPRTQRSQSPSLGTKQINPHGAKLAHLPGAISAPAFGSPEALTPFMPWGELCWVQHPCAVLLGPLVEVGGEKSTKAPPPPPLTHPHLSPPQALSNSTAEYESLESEVSALHDDLWEQLNLDIQVRGTPQALPCHPPGSPLLALWRCSDHSTIPALQNEMLNRQIQKEIWRIQDVMEGLRKNNPSRGTDTAKHRGQQAPSLSWHSTNLVVPWLGTALVPPSRAGGALVHILLPALLHSGHRPLGDLQLQQPCQPPELSQSHQPPQPLLPRLWLPGLAHQARTW